MIGLMLGVFQLFLRKVLFREVAKRRVWVFGCVVVLPWLIAFVVLFADDAFELVLTLKSGSWVVSSKGLSEGALLQLGKHLWKL